MKERSPLRQRLQKYGPILAIMAATIGSALAADTMRSCTSQQKIPVPTTNVPPISENLNYNLTK